MKGKQDEEGVGVDRRAGKKEDEKPQGKEPVLIENPLGKENSYRGKKEIKGWEEKKTWPELPRKNPLMWKRGRLKPEKK